MAIEQRSDRQRAVKDLKRGLILEAARKVFEAEGLDGASLRAIAAAAGYTPAALYFHFDSKEAIYAEVLRASLANLVRPSVVRFCAARRRRNGFAPRPWRFFRYYADNPRDLDLGFYLFRGGMKPQGLGKERTMRSSTLPCCAALAPIADAAMALGAGDDDAKVLMVETFAHAAGLLLLAHTGRMRTFGTSAPHLMERFVADRIAALTANSKP